MLLSRFGRAFVAKASARSRTWQSRQGATLLMKKGFSTTGSTFNELLEVLSDEIEGETDNAVESTVQSMIENFSKNGRTMRHDAGSARVDITLENKVVVSFDCRDIVTDEENEDASIQNASSVEFDVTVKNDHGRRLIFECLASENDGITIDSVSFYHEQDQEQDQDVYDGPKFVELDPRLQAAFYGYLDTLGITIELSSFINNFASQKEALEYLDWLQNVQAFVNTSEE